VFPGEGPLPDRASQDELVAAMIAERGDRIGRAVEERGGDPAFVAEYRQAVESIVGTGPPTVEAERLSSVQEDGYKLERWVLRDANAGAVMPALLFIPESRRVGQATLFVSPEGKSGLGKADGSPSDAVRRAILEEGRIVAAIDVFRTGDTSNVERKLGKFPDTFVPTDTACRVQDVRTAIEWLSEHTGRAPIDVRGYDEAQVWCALGVALARAYATTEVDPANLPATDEDWVAKHYIPCLRSLGGVQLIAGALAPGRVRFAGG
jgi:hypothetical protein